MGAERQSVSAAVAQSVCWWPSVDIVYVIPFRAGRETIIQISANLHDADVIDVVNAPFVWVCD
jgi:hypothetical protein